MNYTEVNALVLILMYLLNNLIEKYFYRYNCKSKVHISLKIFILILILTTNYIYISDFANADSKDQRVSNKEKNSKKDDPKFIPVSWQSAKDSDVTFEKVGPNELVHTIELFGEISANEDTVSHIHPRFAGIVKKVLKNLGDSVAAGDLLTVIQSNDSLALYEIKSEIEGIVTSKNISNGGFIKDDQEIFTITDLKSVWVNSAIYEGDIGKIKIGMPVTIEASSKKNKQDSVISYLNPIISKINRTQSIKVILKNLNDEWLPGQFVNLKIIISKEKIDCSVPIESVVNIDDESYVFVKK